MRVACRDQVVMRMLALDQMLPADDEARTVVAFVEQVDLSELYRRIRAVEGGPGQAPIDPKILLSLWLFATIKGVGSARELNRLCERHLSYQWICGDVSVNYHTLSDFRVNHAEFLDDLLTRQIAQLMSVGAVTLERVAQDGVRVRASAGASSFRRKPTLEQCLVEAQAQVTALREEVERDPAAATRREQAARERAAREREQRVRDALVACDEVHAAKEKRGRDSLKQPARGSTTDPDARKMKMPDGGTRPAFNVQFATDTASQVIVGVDATNAGTDAGQLGPMSQQIESRTGQRPQAYLADGGFASDDDLEELNDPGDGPKIYLPVRDAEKKRANGIDPFAPLPNDSPARAEWRQRMGTESAQAIYKERASTAECVNALARQRGLTQFRVRGLAKVKLIATWFALAHNVLRWAFFQKSPRMAAGR
ncbi:MAG: IS1182 family transposase [Nitrospirota bacterium]